MTRTIETRSPRPHPTTAPDLLGTPRRWVAWTVALFALLFALGFTAKALHDVPYAEVGVWLNGFASPALDQLALTADLIDRPLVAAGILALAFAALLVPCGWRRALGACLVAGCGWLTTLGVKATVAQPRPDLTELAHPLHVSPATLSFPSGHVVFVTALVTALVLACRNRLAALTVGLVGAVLVLVVAWSRLYLGVHFVTDVVGGMLNGVAGALLFAGLWNLAARRLPRATRVTG